MEIEESEQSQSDERPKRRRGRFRRVIKRTLVTLTSLVAVWLSADLIYSIVVERNHSNWEDSIARDSQGIRKDCEAFTVLPPQVDADKELETPTKSDETTVILMVHGINESPHAYRKVAPQLAKHGFACRAMLLDGFARPLAEYEKSTMADWLKSVDAEVRVLRRKYRKIVLMGHSLGGAIVIEYVSRNPDQIDAMILAAPGIKVSNKRSPVLSVRSWHSLLSRTLVFTRMTQSPFGMDALDPKEQQSDMRTPFTPLAVIDQTFDLIDSIEDKSDRIRIPVLLCLAKQDKVIDNEVAQKFHARQPHPANRLKVLDKSGHAILVDYEWKALCAESVLFLNALRK